MNDNGIWAMHAEYEDAVEAIRKALYKWQTIFVKAEWFAKILREEWPQRRGGTK